MNPAWGQKGPNGERVKCVPVETCIIQHPKVWEASGHIAGFNDPMVDDKETKGRFRADHLCGLYLRQVTDENGYIGIQHSNFLREIADGKSAPPEMTVIASTEGEALELFMPMLKKKFKGLDVSAHVGIDDGQTMDVYITDPAKKLAWMAEIKMIPLGWLKSNFLQTASPFTGKKGSLTEPRQFNLMFKTYVGATASEDDVAFLRPETAQGIFVQFKNVVDTTRIKVPFGIGNTGKSFRNEVTPRNFTFRSREFEQAELEFFCHPDESVGY